MTSLKKWEDKIKVKRKKTPFRDFLKQIASWFPINFYKINGKISRYPDSDRIGKLLSATDYLNLSKQDIYYKDIDSKKSFFDQFGDFMCNSYLPILWNFGLVENSDYADTVGFGIKNSYLTICSGLDTQNIFYSVYVINNCINVYNSVGVTDGCSNIYFGAGIIQSYNIFFSKNIINSFNIRFGSNLIGCSECIFCNNLDNKSYCINNKQYTKEEYFEQKQRILQNKDKYIEYFLNIPNDGMNIGSTNCTGKYIINSENVQNGFFVNQVQDGRNLIIVGDGTEIQECYDNISSATRAEKSYGNMGSSPGFDMYCNMNSGGMSTGSDHIYYCIYCQDTHHCLGCIGLQNKSYCILNKQYTKEERYSLADKIFSQMDEQGVLGDFFPGYLNPFYFNDTMAYLIDDSFTKEEVVSEGYMRRDEEIKVDIPDNSKVIKVQDLDIVDYDESILDKVIQDKNGNYYKIVKMEYEFLRKHDLPLPQIHWMDRIKLGLNFN